jgi:hypothetical protein
LDSEQLHRWRRRLTERSGDCAFADDWLPERGHFELASDFDVPEPALRLRRGTEKGPSLFEPDP